MVRDGIHLVALYVSSKAHRLGEVWDDTIRTLDLEKRVHSIVILVVKAGRSLDG